jgi:hypothetical protein
MPRKKTPLKAHQPDQVMISQYSYKLDIVEGWNQYFIEAPGFPVQAGIINTAYFDGKLHLWAEHSTTAPCQPVVIYIYTKNYKREYKPEEILVGTFFKNQQLFAVYIYTP